ncbi:hypothetical protein C8J56DRAFT_755974, partial [Mycena floridula]
YLRVSNPQHRPAFVHVMLSGHALAIERMRWNERGKAMVPREWRLCRFCYVGQEDVIHASLLCPETRLFYQDLNHMLPGFRGRFLDPGLFLRVLVAERETVNMVENFCYEMLLIF